MMGSGETSPTMVTPHQNILKEFEPTAKRILLDTPFGFQTNAEDLIARIQHYFDFNVGFRCTPLQFRSAQEAKNEEIESADWVFSGPGSPSYALKVWRSAGTADSFKKVLEHGTLVLSSAAAISMGSHSLPVYEIYKVGDEPFWMEGLNILEAATGLKAAVIPHYNNAEGGSHDTSICFVGEKRMQQLETLLPDDVFILGIDEHTGVRFDLETKHTEVFGRGSMTIRMGGERWEVPSGSSVPFSEIAAHAGTRLQAIVIEEVATKIATESPATPFIDALISMRNEARARGDYESSDQIRNKLTELGVEVHDGANGVTWNFTL